METGLLDEIYVNFLIVGHTHISIDQYFSVLSRVINRAEFIGERKKLRQECIISDCAFLFV